MESASFLLYVADFENSIADYISTYLNFIGTLGNALSFLPSFLFGGCSGRLREKSCAIDVDGYTEIMIQRCRLAPRGG